MLQDSQRQAGKPKRGNLRHHLRRSKEAHPLWFPGQGEALRSPHCPEVPGSMFIRIVRGCKPSPKLRIIGQTGPTAAWSTDSHLQSVPDGCCLITTIQESRRAMAHAGERCFLARVLARFPNLDRCSRPEGKENSKASAILRIATKSGKKVTNTKHSYNSQA